MIKKNQHWLNLMNAIQDIFIIMVAYLISVWLWLDLFRNDAQNIAAKITWQTFFAALGYSLCLVLLYKAFHLYDSFRFRMLRNELATVWNANTIGILGIAALLYLFKLGEFSRGVLTVFYLLSLLFVSARRVILRKLLHYLRKIGYNQKHVVVVGNGALARQYVKNIRENASFGFEVDGYVSKTERKELGNRLGTFEELEQILVNPSIDEVVVALEPHEIQYMPLIISACEKQGTKVSIIPFFNDYFPTYPTVDVIGSSKLINLRTVPLDNLFYATIKRTIDIVCSVLGLVVLSPLFLVVAIGVKLSSRGPVFFKQKRVGYHKKNFVMYKFRSMRMNDQESVAWSKNIDTRKTRFGSFLRKTSMDELPQLFNVLKGDMSLVGDGRIIGATKKTPHLCGFCAA